MEINLGNRGGISQQISAIPFLFIFLVFGLSAKANTGDETYAKAMQLYHSGKFEAAKDIFTESLNKNPNQPYAYLYRGFCYASLHEYKEAQKDYDIAAKTLKNNAELEFGEGYLCNEKGQYKEAIVHLDKAISINPKYALAYNTRGVSYQSMGKPKLAIENYSAAISIDSTLAIAYNNRGSAIYENQDVAKATRFDILTAIKDFDHAIREDPGFCLAFRNRGMAYSFINKNKEAVRDMDAAVNCEGTNAVFYINRGTILIKAGQYDRAIADFKESLNLDPKQAEAEAYMGEAYSKAGNLDEAIDCEKRAVAIDKIFEPLAAYNMGRFYADHKDKSEMLKCLNLAKKYNYFVPNDNLADFLKAPEFKSFRNDKDFQKFRDKVRGNR